MGSLVIFFNNKFLSLSKENGIKFYGYLSCVISKNKSARRVSEVSFLNY